MGHHLSLNVAGTIGADFFRTRSNGKMLAAGGTRPSRSVNLSVVDGRLAAYTIPVIDGAHAPEHGLDVIAGYVEIESARGERLERRLEIAEALLRTKLTGGTLLVARLDRLTRSVAVTSRLLESKVRFRVCDVQWATPLTIGMLAVLAEHESRLISERMHTAIAAGKAAGRVCQHVINLTPESKRQNDRRFGGVARR